MQYSEQYRRELVAKLLGPERISCSELARRTGVSNQSLSRWLLAARMDPMSKQKKPTNEPQRANGTKRWTPEEKLRVLAATVTLQENELGQFVRAEGLRVADIERYRAEALAGLSTKPRALTAEKLRISELERELNRKDKALAETAALLVLRKKVQALWGVEGKNTTPKSEP
jgi:transposase